MPLVSGKLVIRRASVEMHLVSLLFSLHTAIQLFLCDKLSLHPLPLPPHPCCAVPVMQSDLGRRRRLVVDPPHFTLAMDTLSIVIEQ